jgi:predicted DNA-binding transcriptional regulator
LDKHKVAEKLGISNETGRKLLKSLVRAGYLREDAKKNPYSYTLLLEEPKQLVSLENTSQYESYWRERLEKPNLDSRDRYDGASAEESQIHGCSDDAK